MNGRADGFSQTAREAQGLLIANHGAAALRAQVEELYALHRSEHYANCVKVGVGLIRTLSRTSYRWMTGQAALELAACRDLEGDLPSCRQRIAHGHGDSRQRRSPSAGVARARAACRRGKENGRMMRPSGHKLRLACARIGRRQRRLNRAHQFSYDLAELPRTRLGLYGGGVRAEHGNRVRIHEQSLKRSTGARWIRGPVATDRRMIAIAELKRSDAPVRLVALFRDDGGLSGGCASDVGPYGIGS